MVDVLQLARKNILNLKPYASARDEFSGEAKIFLDANENAFGTPLTDVPAQNRYPDPHQRALKQKIAEIYGVKVEQTFLGNGSDEAIDLLMRIFGNPGKDAVVIMPPTYGMYKVCANINDLQVLQAPLTPEFQMDRSRLQQMFLPQARLLFICSPNNPTGNVFEKADIEFALQNFSGIVVVDEAYIDFAPELSVLPLINEYSHLVVLRTFSKAWGSARIRLGMAFTSPEVIGLMNKIKMPYNVSGLTQDVALKLLANKSRKQAYIEKIIEQRQWLRQELKKLKAVIEVFPSQANFLLVRFSDARAVFNYLMQKGIIVRDRSNQLHCDNCLRITVGTEEENVALIKALRNWENA